MSNLNYNELIEQYLTGTISDVDRSVLESKLAADVSLRTEMKTQSDIVSGLKEFRKAELKGRLDNLPLEVGVLGTLGESVLVKVGATLATTALLVGGMYYFNENPLNSAPIIKEVAPRISYQELERTPGTELKSLPGVQSPSQPLVKSKESVQFNVPATTETEPELAEEVSLAFEKPSVVEFEEEEFEAASVGKENALAGDDPVAINKPIDIEVNSEKSSNNKLQYQFYEERLYLYGSFGEVPYEILEINSKDGKRIYLYHQDDYYKLSYPTNKVTDLIKVTNEDLIEELKIFRDKKAHN